MEKISKIHNKHVKYNLLDLAEFGEHVFLCGVTYVVDYTFRIFKCKIRGILCVK